MKVYFNNSCKICKAEIDLYKKEKVQEIEFDFGSLRNSIGMDLVF